MYFYRLFPVLYCSVVWCVADMQRTLCALTPRHPLPFHHRYWLQTLATVLNVPLTVPAHGGEFGAALGAARLANIGMHAGTGTGAGAGAAQRVGGKTPQDVLLKPPQARTILPNAALQEQYERGYAQYVASFAHLKAVQG